MRVFWLVKSKLARFYKEFETWFKIIFKFIVAYLVFGYINDNLGYFELVTGNNVRIVLSLICSIVPSSIFVLLAVIITLLHLYKLSLYMMVLVAIVMLVFYFIYLKFAPEHGVLMLVIPILMPYNLQYMVPFIAGLFYNPFTIVPVACMFIITKVVHFAVEAAPMLEGVKLDVEKITSTFQYVIDHVIENREMLMYAAVFGCIIVVVYLVSRIPFDFAWYIGIGLGLVAGLVGLHKLPEFIGITLDNDYETKCMVIACILTMVLQFLHTSVDYAKKEYLQFEDDDYFYYVKALPKLGSPGAVTKKAYNKQVIRGGGRREQPSEDSVSAAEVVEALRPSRRVKGRRAEAAQEAAADPAPAQIQPAQIQPAQVQQGQAQPGPQPGQPQMTQTAKIPMITDDGYDSFDGDSDSY